ncbi:hypothetical protein E2C00_25555 [Streptomyces sp. WAC05374]|uniref:hypothetical protein n=1 Tax=Streptomyces sp. WAC05374 TaxID=2487420 RepID=UPI000F86C327|nr:hypothetical protein [Streptomyces sp. WAC05374]RST17620.1 hypothetical protein EF905_08945 [Streptomyces sp. WAC05374]TDF36763.1 hypothetical protein E2B92_30975 [Streptomyces sp. WAC05374]TDF45809.1 hypothetical protein E2C02_32625 [Streptomyces sp. WAC05374]TDF51475.1 hypothetical protein E2C00_25555 [Streptomyces sp. WAC05374]
MQTSAVPDLAHTHARPIHWLATAAAMAAVVAGAAMLQPEAATASQTGGITTAAAPAPAPAPDPAAVTYPLDCAGAPSVVAKRATGDIDGDGRPETVVAAHCRAGSGTPPSGLYVLARGAGTGARVVATLVEPRERRSVSEVSVSGGAVGATLFGYSSPDVPSCCPDQRETVKWRWEGDKFVRSATAARSA